MFRGGVRGESAPERLSGGGALRQSVERELLGADAETITVVTSITGLLGALAYADRDYSPEEEARVRVELGRVQGMTETGVDAICKVLRERIVEISTVEMPHFTRALVELGDRELRLEVLRALVDLAAADATITLAETNMLRHLTKALGLSQQDYVELQSQHRHLLASLAT